MASHDPRTFQQTATHGGMIHKQLPQQDEGRIVRDKQRESLEHRLNYLRRNHTHAPDLWSQSGSFAFGGKLPRSWDLTIFTVTVPRTRFGVQRNQYIKRHIMSILRSTLRDPVTDDWNAIWLLVEDAATIDSGIHALLDSSGIPFIYAARGPSHCFANAQIAFAYDFIVDKLEANGYVYAMDDDNFVHPRVFERIINLKKVDAAIALFPIVIEPNVCEHPVISPDGTVQMAGGWPERKIPVDFGAYVIHTELLRTIQTRPLWSFNGIYGETEFLEKFIDSVSEMYIYHDFQDCRHRHLIHNKPIVRRRKHDMQET